LGERYGCEVVAYLMGALRSPVGGFFSDKPSVPKASETVKNKVVEGFDGKRSR